MERNWKEFPSHSKDWRKFECNENTISLNILYVPYKKEKIKPASRHENVNENDNCQDGTKQIRPAYISKHNKERATQVNLLMITDGTDN